MIINSKFVCFYIYFDLNGGFLYTINSSRSSLGKIPVVNLDYYWPASWQKSKE